MIKIFFILISLLLQVKNTQIKDHRPVYIPDKNITIDNGLNDNSRFLDDSSSSSSLLYLNPISYQYIISSGILEYLTFTLKAVNLKSTVYYSYSSIRFSSSSNANTKLLSASTAKQIIIWFDFSFFFFPHVCTEKTEKRKIGKHKRVG